MSIDYTKLYFGDTMIPNDIEFNQYLFHVIVRRRDWSSPTHCYSMRIFLRYQLHEVLGP